METNWGQMRPEQLVDYMVNPSLRNMDFVERVVSYVTFSQEGNIYYIA